MVHGDDFVAVWSAECLVDTRATLETKYSLKVESLSEGTECQQCGETGHEWIGRGLETMARRLSTPG